MLRAAGLPWAPRLGGRWERAAASPALGSGASWERISSLGGRRAQLRIPRPGSCPASSGLCRSGRGALAPACPFVGTRHPFTPPQARISILAAGWYAQAAAFSWFVFVVVEAFCFLPFFLFPMPTHSAFSPYQERQSWVRYPGCCHSGCVRRKWPLPAASDRVPWSLGAAGRARVPKCPSGQF